MGTIGTVPSHAPEEVAMPEMTASAAIALELLRGASMAAVRVFTAILTQGPVSRVRVAQETGLSQAAVTKAVGPLLATGIIANDERGLPDGLPGRPANPLRVVSDALITIGVKLNADEVIAVATDLRTRLLAVCRLPLLTTDLEETVERIAQAVAHLEQDLGSARGRLIGVGVSVSGDVDTEHGTVRESARMGWRGAPLGKLLSERLGRTVVVENDVRALTIGEHWFGLGVGTASLAIVTLGDGIGCGLYLNGDVVEGAHGVAGEIGHLPLADPGAICSCGRRGCVEAVASAGAIVDAVSRSAGRPLTLAQAHALADQGDPAAIAAFRRAARVIGLAIATMTNLTGPELVLLGGEGVSNADFFETEMRTAFAEHAFGASGAARILTCRHSFEDWARGAAAAFIRQVVVGGRTRP